jgi:hypothetical protein
MRLAWISLALNAITFVILIRTFRQMRQTDRVLADIEAALDKAEDALDRRGPPKTTGQGHAVFPFSGGPT